MKKITILSLVLLCTSICYADGAKQIDSKLKEATVFFTGAELTHTATATLIKGENEIVISNLSPNIDQRSLKVSASGNAIINSTEFSIDYLQENQPSPEKIKVLEDSIKIYQKNLRLVQTNLKTNRELIDLLNDNREIAGDGKGLNVDELIKLVNFYESKSSDIQKKIMAYEEDEARINARLSLIQLQLKEMSLKGSKSIGQVKVKLIAPIATTSTFTLSYYTSQAQWTPQHNINITSVDKPVQFLTKAKVKQITGLDWNKVKLTLSTSTPSFGKEAPLFNAWFLRASAPSQRLTGSVSEIKMNEAVAQNSFSYGELSEVVVTGYGTQRKDVVTPSPIYVVNGEVISENQFKDIDPNLIASIDVLKDDNAKGIYGSRASGGAIVVTLKSLDDFVKVNEDDLIMSYAIDLPFSIPGNGKEQLLDLTTNSSMADFKYYSAPKLDKATFLLAEIKDWQKLNLLAGSANITYAGTYVGETAINPYSTQSTLALTLGTENRITVKREKQQDFSSTKFLGNDKKQEFTYLITVKNNSNETATVTLKDQYPISTDKSIQVELLKETTPPSHNNETVGTLTWNFELKAGETKTFKTSYSVKYPKDSSLNL